MIQCSQKFLLYLVPAKWVIINLTYEKKLILLKYPHYKNGITLT